MPRRWVGVVGRGPTSVPIEFIGVETNTGSFGLDEGDFTIDVPAGVQEGDFLLLSGVGTAPLSTTLGWTTIDLTGLWNSRTTELHYRYATASEPASYTNPARGRVVGAISAYRGVAQSFPINAQSLASNNSGSPVLPSVTTTVDNCWLVAVIGGEHAGGGQSWTMSMTERWDVSEPHADSVSGAGGDEALTLAGATGTRSFTYSGGGSGWGGVMAALTPEFP